MATKLNNNIITNGAKNIKLFGESVVDLKNESVEAFSIKLPLKLVEPLKRTHMRSHVIEKVIEIYNEFSLEEVDDYLLDEGDISQDEREIIVEGIWSFDRK